MQGYENGFYMGGCLFDNVTPTCASTRKRFSARSCRSCARQDYEEALRLSNDHEYGNGVAIFTRDGDAARDFAAQVKVGMVGVNVPIPVPLAYYTFGGWKRSGFGDLNQHGPDSIRFYTKTKTVTARWPSGIKERRGVRHPDDEVVLLRHNLRPHPEEPPKAASRRMGRKLRTCGHPSRRAP